MVKVEGEFEARALRILREIPGIVVPSKPAGETRREADAVLRFGDERIPILVEVKRRANTAVAWQLVRHARERPGLPVLLIAEDTTSDARQILEDHGIAVVDGRGNAHFELPGLLIHVEGRASIKTARDLPPARLAGKAGVIAQALLVHRERAWQVKDLADEAKVSTGLAHRVLVRLEREGIVAVEGTGPRRVRRVANATALLDLWAEENVERATRTTGHLLARTPQELIRLLGINLGRSGVDYALTGAGAASLIAAFITAVPVVQVWVSATAAAEELFDASSAAPVVEGQNIVFLQAKDDTPLVYREMKKDLWVANRFRVYADLRLDPRRGREQAQHLREEVIGF